MDMSEFPDGPWKNEPTGPMEFEHAGMACLIRRGPLGAWCGYVVIPQYHPLYGADMVSDECVALRAHGGVSYAGSGITGCDGKFVIGFDCGHFGDLVPRMIKYYSGSHYDIYRDVDYVTAETKKLAEQISALNKNTPQPDDFAPCIGGQRAEPNIIERNENWRHILRDPDFETTFPDLMDRVNKFDEKDEMIVQLAVGHIDTIVNDFPYSTRGMIDGFEVGCLSKILGIDTFKAYIFALAILKDYDGIGGHISDVKHDLENGW